MAFEAGWVDLGEFKYTGQLPGRTFTERWRAQGVNLAGVMSLPIGQNFAPFVKAGLLRAEVRAEAQVSGSQNASASASDTSWRPNYGAGLVYNLNPSVGIRAEIERFHKIGESKTTGSASVDLYTIGLMYRF